jgi:hypothetical protein
MAVISTTAGTPAVVERDGSATPVEWGAIAAGAVLAASLSFVFLTFGSAASLSMTSAWPESGAPSRWVLSLAVFWVMAQQIGAFLAGGYVTGLLRRHAGPRTDQTELRDGLHGAMVWGVGIVIGAILAGWAATAVTRTGGEAVRTVANATSQSVGQFTYFADVMLRPQPQAPGQAAPAQQQPALSQETRQEIAGILGRAAVRGQLSQADRGYLSSIIAQRTGVTADEAQRRVTETVNEAERSVRDAADRTRRAAALGGFITAASLLIGFAAAWWGAMRGGQHRDQNWTHTGLYLRSKRVKE